MMSTNKSDTLWTARGLGRAALAGVVLAACAVGTGGTAGGAPPSPGAGALLTGHVIGAAGGAGAGATVTLEAWPNSAALAALPDGGSVTPLLVTTTYSDDAGDYALDPDLSALADRYVEPGGTVNLDVTVTDPSTTDDASETFSFTAARPGSTSEQDNPLVATGERRQSARFDLHDSTVTTALGAAPLRTVPTANTARATASRTTAADAGAARAASPVGGCIRGWKKAGNYPKRPETFMNLWTVGTASVDEEVGSSHSLGVGVAVTGGVWSASGSVTVSTHTSAGGQNTYAGNYSLRNYVNYARYVQTCYKRTTHGTVTYYKHRLSSTGMHSLLVGQTGIKDHVWGTTTESWKRRCTPNNGGAFHKTKGSNIDFEAGVNAPFISLKAQASYSKDTVVTGLLPRSGKSYICGSTDAGPVSSPYAGEDRFPGPSTGGCGSRCQVADEGSGRR